MTSDTDPRATGDEGADAFDSHTARPAPSEREPDPEPELTLNPRQDERRPGDG